MNMFRKKKEQVAIEVHDGGFNDSGRSRKESFHSFEDMNGGVEAVAVEDEIHWKTVVMYLFVLLNHLQQLGIISSPYAFPFPEDWTTAFGWLSDVALLDVTAFFDDRSEVDLVLKLLTATLLPFALWGLVYLLRSDAFDRLIYLIALTVLIPGVILMAVASVQFENGDLRSFLYYFGALCVAFPLYYIVRTVFAGEVSKYYERLYDDDELDMSKTQIDAEIYFWLFLLVAIYASVLRTSFFFFKVPGNSALQGTGVTFPLLAALFTLGYVFRTAQRAEDGNTDAQYAVFFRHLFKEEFWYFQVVFLADKSVHLLLNLIPDKMVAAILSLLYMIAFAAAMFHLKPFEEDGLVPGTQVTISKVDLAGRISNVILLLLALINFQQRPPMMGRRGPVSVGDSGSTLSVLCVVVSVLTLLGWLFVVYAFSQTAVSSYEHTKYRNAWLNLGLDEMLYVLKKRTTAMRLAEYQGLNDQSKEWLYSNPTLKQLKPKFCCSVLALMPHEYYQQKLDLSIMSLSNSHCRLVAVFLEHNRGVNDLNLYANDIGPPGAGILTDALMLNKTVKTLDLGWNHVGDTGTTRIAQGLLRNATITSLTLRRNEIGVTGAEALAGVIRKNSTLVFLNLRLNNIGDEGAIAIGEALQQNETLLTLDLGNNMINERGAWALATALRMGSSLQTLILQRNNIGVAGAAGFGEALEENSTLTNLDLRMNEMGNQGADSICRALESNSMLKTLDLGANNINENGVTSVEHMLRHNTTLRHLKLIENVIPELVQQNLKNRYRGRLAL